MEKDLNQKIADIQEIDIEEERKREKDILKNLKIKKEQQKIRNEEKKLEPSKFKKSLNTKTVSRKKRDYNAVIQPTPAQSKTNT